MACVTFNQLVSFFSREGGYQFKFCDFNLGQEVKSKSPVDYLSSAKVGGISISFFTELKIGTTPRLLESALGQLRSFNKKFDGKYPLLCTEFASKEAIERCRQEKVSILDMSGNGLIYIPGKVYICEDSKPNKYPRSQGIKNIYNGTSSLVCRALLQQEQWLRQVDIEKFINSRGSRITRATISKVLKVLVEDCIVSEKSLKLIQPIKLLNNLTAEHKNSLRSKPLQFKVKNRDLLNKRLREINCREPFIAYNEETSLRLYTAYGSNVTPTLCCKSLEEFMINFGDLVSECSFFPDIQVYEETAPTFYFDLFDNLYSSKLQTYIAMSRGDKRQTEMASILKNQISCEVKS